MLTTRESQQERLTWVMIYSCEFVQEKVKLSRYRAPLGGLDVSWLSPLWPDSSP